MRPQNGDDILRIQSSHLPDRHLLVELVSMAHELQSHLLLTAFSPMIDRYMDDARRLVVRGFFNEIVSEIGIEEVQERIMARIDDELAKAGK